MADRPQRSALVCCTLVKTCSVRCVDTAKATEARSRVSQQALLWQHWPMRASKRRTAYRVRWLMQPSLNRLVMSRMMVSSAHTPEDRSQQRQTLHGWAELGKQCGFGSGSGLGQGLPTAKSSRSCWYRRSMEHGANSVTDVGNGACSATRKLGLSGN